MEVTVLSQEKSEVLLEVKVPGEVLTKAIDAAYGVYKKNHEKFDVLRAGIDHNPQGQDVMREAIQNVFSDVYAEAIAKSGFAVASEPQISVMKASEEECVEYQVRFALRPEIKLGQYKGLHAKMPFVEVTEEEYLEALMQVRKMNAAPQNVDRPAENGDIAVIDFTGYLDGVPFDGGAGQGYPLTLGSGSFIPGFEEQLVGKSAGENVLVTVTFPEDYHAENLAGKLTQFRVSVNAVQEMVLAELTAEEETEIRKAVAEHKQAEADQKIEDQVLGQIVEEAKVELPVAMVDSEINICMQQFVSQISAQGIELETYAKQIGKTPKEMAEEMRPLATRRIMLRLVLGAIAEAEGVTVSDEEVENEWNVMAQQYHVTVGQMKLYAGEGADEQIKADLAHKKAYEILRESTILDME